MNAHITELVNNYGVVYRSDKRTGKGRRVYLLDIHEATDGDGGDDTSVANVGNDGILNTEAGGENSYNTYTTYTDAPDGQEGA